LFELRHCQCDKLISTILLQKFEIFKFITTERTTPIAKNTIGNATPRIRPVGSDGNGGPGMAVVESLVEIVVVEKVVVVVAAVVVGPGGSPVHIQRTQI